MHAGRPLSRQTRGPPHIVTARVAVNFAQRSLDFLIATPLIEKLGLLFHVRAESFVYPDNFLKGSTGDRQIVRWRRAANAIEHAGAGAQGVAVRTAIDISSCFYDGDHNSKVESRKQKSALTLDPSPMRWARAARWGQRALPLKVGLRGPVLDLVVVVLFPSAQGDPHRPT